MGNKERMEQLATELNKYAYEYYVLGNPSIADKDYDEKYYELVELEKQEGIILPYSPTQRKTVEFRQGSSFYRITRLA